MTKETIQENASRNINNYDSVCEITKQHFATLRSKLESIEFRRKNKKPYDTDYLEEVILTDKLSKEKEIMFFVAEIGEIMQQSYGDVLKKENNVLKIHNFNNKQ